MPGNDYNHQTGRHGETLAAAWLQQQGHTIIERNWRFKHWEVDIITAKDNRLHFVEIKTRTNTRFGHPEESIGRKKMASLRAAAEEYQYRHPGWKYLQFDVLAINLHINQPPDFFLIEDVYF